MKINEKYHKGIVNAAVLLLKDIAPEVSEEKLLNALGTYDSEKEQLKAVSIKDAANLLEVSEMTIRRAINDNKIKCFKVNRKSIRISLSELIKMKENEHYDFYKFM